MKAIDEVAPPTNLKELQSLLGKINFVRRFISNLSQKLLPFSPLLKLKKIRVPFGSWRFTTEWVVQHYI
jgi:hypothetical protein